MIKDAEESGKITPGKVCSGLGLCFAVDLR